MDYAEDLIKKAKLSGAHIIKFQTYKAEKLVSKSAQRFWDWKGEVKKKGGQYDSYSRLDKFGFKEYKKLKKLCDKYKIEFMSTPFDIDSVDMLCDLGIAAFKIASCDITNYLLIEHIAKTIGFDVYYWSTDFNIIHNLPEDKKRNRKYLIPIDKESNNPYGGSFDIVIQNGGEYIFNETNFQVNDCHLGEKGHKVQSELFFKHITNE
jgi:hypothetical protein